MIIKVKKVIYNLKKKNKKTENLIFCHDRFFQEENGYKDIYTYFLWDNLKNSEIIYPLFCPEIYINKNYNYSFVETIGFIISKLKIKLINNFKIEKNLEEKLLNIKKELENDLKIKNINILELENIKKTLKKFIYEKSYYKNLLNLKKPKKIYIVCSYGKESLISAANDLGIDIIEIQHGGIDKYHLGYFFPKKDNIPYFPNKIMMFGEYWYSNTQIPLDKKNIEFIGYPYLQKQIAKFNNIKENNDQILFISQGTIGKELTEKAIEFARENQDKKVVIRLHPGEFKRWKKEYEMLYKNRNLPNIEISDNNKKTLYEYLFESKYLICVYSTVIYEALYLGKKIGILNLSGVEYIEDLIVKKMVHKFENKINLFELDKLKKIDSNYFFNNFKE